MRITVSRTFIIKALAFTVFFLTAISLICAYGHYLLQTKYSGFLNQMFNLDLEKNIPTWYSTCALLFAFQLLTLIALGKTKVRDKYYRHWIILALFFLYMSVDEFVSIHERATAPLVSLLGTSGFFWDAWVLIWGPLTLVFGFCYLRFLLHLSRQIRGRFVAGGLIFVGGAIGVEMIAANYAWFHGMDNMTYKLLEHAEEFLEMIGIVIFISGLLLFINAIEINITADTLRDGTPVNALVSELRPDVNS